MWNFKGYLWNYMQNILSMHRKIYDFHTKLKFYELLNLRHFLNTIRTLIHQTTTGQICLPIWSHHSFSMYTQYFICANRLSSLQGTSFVLWIWHVARATIGLVICQITATQKTNLTNSTMLLFHIPQCTIQKRDVHISLLNGALLDMELGRCIMEFVN